MTKPLSKNEKAERRWKRTAKKEIMKLVQTRQITHIDYEPQYAVISDGDGPADMIPNGSVKVVIVFRQKTKKGGPK
jgi:hypothetical protein